MEGTEKVVSTEMVRCGYCGEMVEAGECGWHIGWICPNCIEDAWLGHCEMRPANRRD